MYSATGAKLRHLQVPLPDLCRPAESAGSVTAETATVQTVTAAFELAESVTGSAFVFRSGFESVFRSESGSEFRSVSVYPRRTWW